MSIEPEPGVRLMSTDEFVTLRNLNSQNITMTKAQAVSAAIRILESDEDMARADTARQALLDDGDWPDEDSRKHRRYDVAVRHMVKTSRHYRKAYADCHGEFRIGEFLVGVVVAFVGTVGVGSIWTSSSCRDDIAAITESYDRPEKKAELEAKYEAELERRRSVHKAKKCAELAEVKTDQQFKFAAGDCWSKLICSEDDRKLGICDKHYRKVDW